MIHFTTWPQPRSKLDNATCEWNGQQFQAYARGALTQLARRLVDAGAPDTHWEAYTPCGERSCAGKSLFRLGRLTVVENDGEGVRFTRFKERPADLWAPVTETDKAHSATSQP